jgi:hypothetical protein
MTSTTTPPRPRATPRPGVTVFRSPRRHPVPTERAVCALFLVVLAIIGGVGVSLVRAQTSDEDVPRFVPASRGTRPAVVRWRPLLETYDWDVATALRVIDCESEGRAWVPNQQGSGALGLFQAMPTWRGLAYQLTGSTDLADPVVNIAVAYYLWADSGGSFGWWGADGRAHGHWGASLRCWGE